MKRVFQILSGSPDRIIATSSFVFALLSLFFSFYVYITPRPLPVYLLVRDVTIAIMLGLIIFTLTVKYLKKDGLVEGYQELLTRQVACYHLMIHRFRDNFFSNVRMEIAKQGSLKAEDIALIQKKYFKRVCHSVLADTRAIFLDYFNKRGFNLGDDLAVTLKIIVPVEEAQLIINKMMGEKAYTLNANERYLMTGYRDPYTYDKKPERNEVKQVVYHLGPENTVFEQILVKGERVYFCNDLEREFKRGNFRNQTLNWQKFYNSTLAIPVRYRNQEYPQETIPYGALAVDSLNPNRYELFDDKTTAEMLALPADLLALMFGQLDMLQLVKRDSQA